MGCRVAKHVEPENHKDKGWVLLHGEEELDGAEVPEVVQQEPGKWRWLVEEWPGQKTVSCAMVSDVVREPDFSFRLQLHQFRTGYFFMILGETGDIPSAYVAASAVGEDQTPMTASICHKIAAKDIPVTSSTNPIPSSVLHPVLKRHKRESMAEHSVHSVPYRHSIHFGTPPTMLLFTIEFDASIVVPRGNEGM
eukprot:TRINITY_DN25105_c0_g1_i1.p1 TRINITY_DN25105_c0_g1~~TRINITY_DN25105_c0_g1_i1.p1  ORF type:complete len:194 (+),score=27.17 TRINITY_DN25105_c0_g1_i1:108-689(+)